MRNGILPMAATGDVDEKYFKKLNLRRSVSSATLWGKRNKNTILKVVGAAAVVSMVLLATREPRVNVSVEIDYPQEASNDLNLLGITEFAAAQRTVELGDDDVETEEGTPVEEEHEEVEENETVETNNNAENSRAAEESGGEDVQVEETSSTPMEFQRNPDKRLVEMSHEELFENYKELEACGHINVVQNKKRPTDWWALKGYVNMYTRNPPYACVPKLRPHLQLTLDDFTDLFRKIGQPVLFRFENLRKIGFNMRSFTIDELVELFPFDPTKDKTIEYKANKKFTDEYLDLGPAIYSFKDDGALVKTKGGKRNYPRNMKVKPSALTKLGVEAPVLIPGADSNEGVFQTPSLWFGSSTSPTPFHSDCCDNFVLMLTGTKEFALAPPTDWQALTPHCVGKKKGLCYANIGDPTQTGVSTEHINLMLVDVEPGMVLYMPAGWFHAVKNKGATLMTNLWTRGKQTAGIFSCNKK